MARSAAASLPPTTSSTIASARSGSSTLPPTSRSVMAALTLFVQLVGIASSVPGATLARETHRWVIPKGLFLSSTRDHGPQVDALSSSTASLGRRASTGFHHLLHRADGQPVTIRLTGRL